MKKKYQIFISSTFEDLKEERSRAIMEILKLGHIPIGMEMFNPDDDEQWIQIQKNIDEADYFLLIVANRCGTLTKRGTISFTEKEYNYAVKTKIPIIRLVIHKDAPVSTKNIETDPIKLAKLNKFKKKICKNKTVAFWKNTDDFAVKLVQALQYYFEIYPRTGWLSADAYMDPDVMEAYGLNEYGKKAFDYIKQSIEQKSYYKLYERKIELVLLPDNEGLEITITNEIILVNGGDLKNAYAPNPCFESKEQAESYEHLEFVINEKNRIDLIQKELGMRERKVQLPYLVKNTIDYSEFEHEQEISILHKYRYRRKDTKLFMGYQMNLPCKNLRVDATIANDVKNEYKFLCFSASQYKNKKENGGKSDLYAGDHSCQINFGDWTIPGSGYSLYLVKK